MAQHNALGQRGEQLAVDYLKREAYEILEQNWRFSRAEVDIIARKAGVLVFVEVKTRKSVFFEAPENAVDVQKEKLITDAAAVYMEQIGHEWEIRFDIIAIVVESDDSYQITHYEDAFFPEIGS